MYEQAGRETGMNVEAKKDPRRTNHLAGQKSPYLLQHQHNPVDWYPWGEEALRRARFEDKLIFLSVGYSTCHWCHVMERESFENEEVARLLNANFVSIKVDREERPDLDRLYMTFIQATTGQGGWPMNVFLTPNLKPIFGGSYFPTTSRSGHPGLTEVLARVHELWNSRREDLRTSADAIMVHLQEAAQQAESVRGALGQSLIQTAAERLKTGYDPRHGGFGRAPKFPQVGRLLFLLSHGVAHDDREAVGMVLNTCDCMAAGGLCDQLGGGFARYATDEAWMIPHFEKMLYDNALLVSLYLAAYQVSGEGRYAAVARDTLRYLLRDMADPEGGFHAAEDADSEGREGRFYCWTLDEMAALLPEQERAVAVRYYGVARQGNFMDHSDPGPPAGQNVLAIHDPHLSDDEASLLALARTRLFEARRQRARPHRDDKILSSWNGLMVSALAQAYAIIGEESYLIAARRVVAFIRDRLWEPVRKRLHHRWRDGERDEVQLLVDYAFLLNGLIDLHEATLDDEALSFAEELADALIRDFYDSERGGFWESGADCTDLILRTKEDYDGAEPSGNAEATLALLRLAEITGRAELRQASERTLSLYAHRLQEYPEALPYLLHAAAFALSSCTRVTITGDPASTEVMELLCAAHSVYRPFQVVTGAPRSSGSGLRDLSATAAMPAAQVCVGTTCHLPVTRAEDLRDLLLTDSSGRPVDRS